MRAKLPAGEVPDHLGLAYDTWGPVDDRTGKIPDDDRQPWMSRLASIAISPDYAQAFGRWKAGFQAPGERVFELALASRLLVGHGNPSALGVGLTVHAAWGTPILPGTAVKGVLAHYVDAVYGPDEPSKAPWEVTDDPRIAYQGVIRERSRIVRGPGAVYRALFGAPEADQDTQMRERGMEAGATAGLVTFHDALYVPGSCERDRPFATDVLTVHQKPYYDHAGKDGIWPSDYDSPNPVAFLTVRPGARLLFALSGPADWTALAERLLRDALNQWGAGGKTSAGYGRMVDPEMLAPGEDWPQARLRFNRGNGTLTAIGPNRVEAHALAPDGERLLATLPHALQEKIRQSPYGPVQVRVNDGMILRLTAVKS